MLQNPDRKSYETPCATQAVFFVAPSAIEQRQPGRQKRASDARSILALQHQAARRIASFAQIQQLRFLLASSRWWDTCRQNVRAAGSVQQARISVDRCSNPLEPPFCSH